MMHNITLAIDEKLVKKSREYAKKHGKSLNALIRELLQKTVDTGFSDNNMKDLFKLMDEASGNSEGHKWRREDIYDRKVLH